MAQPDGQTHNEVLRRDNQPTGRMSTVYKSAATTMKPGATDGVNKIVPVTNNTKAPGQYGRS